IRARDIVNKNQPCASVPDRASTLKPETALQARNGDALCLLVANEDMFDLAVAAFYVDVSGGVMLTDARALAQGCWTLVGAASGAQGPQALGSGVRIVTDNQGQALPLGYEYLVVVAFELAPGSLPPSICELQQSSIVSTRSAGGKAAALMEVLQPSG